MLPLLHYINNQLFWLSPNRSIYWEAEQALILSDVHLGKTTHFRKAGIAIPMQVFKNDMHRLVADIQFFNPKKIIIVGDLFHSIANNENDFFIKWRNDFLHIQIILVQGNHDILSDSWYANATISVVKNTLTMGSIAFQHNYENDSDTNGIYTFSGHIHPGVNLKGAGRQSLQFPCFYFTNSYCLLPAFGIFTGLAIITPNKMDTIYAIVENEVIKF
jgi:uncharacterized protein